MCLDSLSDKPKHVPKEKGHNVGYKIFRKNCYSKEIYPMYQMNDSSDAYNTTSLPEGKWINEEDYRCEVEKAIVSISIRGTEQSYKPGWHLFYDYKSALAFMPKYCFDTSYKIRKIYYRNPTAYGFQGKIPAIVAKEIMILPA